MWLYGLQVRILALFRLVNKMGDFAEEEGVSDLVKKCLTRSRLNSISK
jgi:hypothetical protein